MRALALIGMWGAMCAAMMLPCSVLPIAYAGVTGHAPARRSLRDHLWLVLQTALVAGLAQWSLESRGVLRGDVLAGGVAMQLALFAVGLAAAAMRLRTGATWAALVVMASLQFAGGAMNVGWMLVVTACMMVLTLSETLLADLAPAA